MVSLNPAADTAISQDDELFDMPGTFATGRLGDPGNRARCRGLLRFDLSSIPTNAVIETVTLSVTVTRYDWGHVDTHAIHPLTMAWSETEASWSTSGEAGWNGGAFAEEGDSTVAFGAGTGTFTFPSTANLLATVQGWVGNAAGNHGWVLRNEDEETAPNARRVGSRESSTPPELTVVYSVAPPPAAPVTLRNPRLAGGQFRFDFTALPETTYTVEYRASVEATNWVTLETHPAPATPAVVTVQDGLGLSNRFYRVVSP